MFFNRETELQQLNKRYQEKKAHLIIVYGRRRAGKTELLKRFAHDKPHIYFLADLSNEKDQLASFTEKIQLFTKDVSLTNNPFANWNALFAYISNISKKQQLIVIIDEYQYLHANNKAISSIIQKFWDEHLSRSKIFLVLCGSYISFMETELLSYKSPLYGRRSGQFMIKPLSFFNARQFFATKLIADQVKIFSILGGTPAYLLQFNSRWSVDKNVIENILHTDTHLYDEPFFLLMQELREPRNYFAILKSIAAGANRINDIVQQSSLERGMVVKYLETLKNLHIIQREVPVTENNPQKSRKGIYTFQDNFFRFWFRFVFPNRSFLEEGRIDFVFNKKIKPYLNQYIGPIFENICIEFLKRENQLGKLPFEIYRIGRFWTKQIELDIVAYDEKRNNWLIGECKWSTKKVGTNILKELIHKSSSIIGQHSGKVYYVLFSKTGFTKALKTHAKENVILVDLNRLSDSF